MEYCSTCATALSSSPPYSQEKSIPEDRRVDCCARIICGKCIQDNPRFAAYCPYCQVSSAPSPLPQGLRDPPSYTHVPRLGARIIGVSPPPPPYSADATTIPTPLNDGKDVLEFDEKAVVEDTLHFLDHEHDSLQALSLRYGVPAAALRRRNNITSDHLLLGRRTILIPGEYYKGGVSLSPRPVEGEEEELRRSKIRRFMTACKVSDYDYALLYLEQASYDLDAAIEAYMDDEAWEREHPNQRRGRDGGTRMQHKDRGPFWRGL